MPQQSPLRIVKRWKRYLPNTEFNEVPPLTRGFYALYEKMKTAGHYEVRYIGVGGLGIKSGIRARIKSHVKQKKKWTHFSFFEVHDNISADEIREVEGLLLAIFSRDPRIDLANVQRGSRRFRQTRNPAQWS